ncbi:MAG TPA: hypothetical protein VE673_14210 [Pseudonocardiaceae bacterium]|nr:hypothetical protein [Pseudonocardiaceae bacterium]
MIGISRERPADTIKHLRADLADPSTWSMVGASFRRELDGFAGEHVAFIHAAGANTLSALLAKSTATHTCVT